MKWVNSDERLPIKSWCEVVEKGALEQARNLANHPCTFHHVALMPDCHLGYGMPIGGVMACKGYIIPNAVGVDIGCGMVAVKTNKKESEVNKEQIENIISNLRKMIPVGLEHHERPQYHEMLDFIKTAGKDIDIVKNQLQSIPYQLGTLGGGNHFAEIQKGDDGLIWLMIHSGSRHFGFKIAKEYNKKAQELCQKWHSIVCPFKGEDGLAFLPTDIIEGKEYMTAMELACFFARANREIMMNKFIHIVETHLKCECGLKIDVRHNYANIEHHFGNNVFVHRKGATSAKKGELGIIPGSMGTNSYIVEGLGNQESFCSCSHGAGRKMGRAAFCKEHTIDECNKDMEGIVFQGWGKDRKGNVDISEAPGAYKDINTVMDSQKDLVRIVTKLEPLGVLKG